MKNLIFVFVLFATLLTVNAAPHRLYERATQFNACPFTDVTFTVVMDPDTPVAGQNVKFDVSGTLKNDITSGKTILGIGFVTPDLTSQSEPYTQVFDQSFAANTPFSIEAKEVPVPSKLSNPYIIGVEIGDPTGDPKNPLDIYGCAFALISTP